MAILVELSQQLDELIAASWIIVSEATTEAITNDKRSTKSLALLQFDITETAKFPLDKRWQGKGCFMDLSKTSSSWERDGTSHPSLRFGELLLYWKK